MNCSMSCSAAFSKALGIATSTASGVRANFGYMTVLSPKFSKFGYNNYGDLDIWGSTTVLV